MGKTWKQKLEGVRPAHVETLDKPFGGAAPGAKMLIATPRDVDDYMRAVPKGEARTIAQMRADLAVAHGADLTCPLTTGIFARIAAEVALEEVEAGADPTEVTPFWRVIDAGSPLAKKLSCGAAFTHARRAAEGT